MPRKRGQVETVDRFAHAIESFHSNRWPPVPPGVMRSVEFKEKIREQMGVGVNLSKEMLREMIEAGKVERFNATFNVDGKAVHSQWVRVLS